jgi:hypothetical protein
MSFAGYKDFDDCVAQNQDKRDPKAFCAWLERQVKSKSEEQNELNDLFHMLTWRSPLRQKSVRRVISSISGILSAIDEPSAKALGATLGALVDLFEKKAKGVKET